MQNCDTQSIYILNLSPFDVNKEKDQNELKYLIYKHLVKQADIDFNLKKTELTNFNKLFKTPIVNLKSSIVEKDKADFLKDKDVLKDTFNLTTKNFGSF